MKRILLLFALFVFSLTGFSQYTFDDCTLTPGFTVGQGASVGPYDNPNKNGCGNADDDCGIITPGVGGNNPAFIATPAIPTPSVNVKVAFDIFVFDANLKCSSAKNFPCATYVTGYIVDVNYSSGSAPATYYGKSDILLLNANGPNFITIPVTTPVPAGTTTRVYLDFSVTGATCNQGGTKYVLDKLILTPDESPLPIKIKSFSAVRNQDAVALKWTTASEQNNKGFEIQKLTGTGGWKPVTFIASKAAGGTSGSDLAYEYNDANQANGVTQYRLKQTDIDSKSHYSDIRSVQGMMQAGKIIISPNPSSNGIVNVTFESANVKRDVQLSDMNGRMLKQWNNYADNSLQIQNLAPGLYQLKMMNKETGQQNVQKIMVTNR